MAGLLNDPVTHTLRQWAAERMVYGQTDCAISVFRYMAEHLGCKKPLQYWSGRYLSEKAANAILRDMGGPVQMFRKQMGYADLKRTQVPQRGDVGLVRNAGRVLAGICVGGGRWAVRADEGFAVFRPDWFVAYGAP